jgi:hypothetical protein
MADVFDAATRSRIMRAIRSRDTKPELALADALVAYGIRYRRDGMRLPGRPDFVLLRSDLVVFVRGTTRRRPARRGARRWTGTGAATSACAGSCGGSGGGRWWCGSTRIRRGRWRE